MQISLSLSFFVSEEATLWRARNFNDVKLYERAQQMKTPNCDALERIYS
jgi:hypothetical protein